MVSSNLPLMATASGLPSEVVGVIKESERKSGKMWEDVGSGGSGIVEVQGLQSLKPNCFSAFTEAVAPSCELEISANGARSCPRFARPNLQS